MSVNDNREITTMEIYIYKYIYIYLFLCSGGFYDTTNCKKKKVIFVLYVL